jgi:hypothetical protein
MEHVFIVVFYVLFRPTDIYLIGDFYAAWMLLFSLTYVVWDVLSPRTHKWHLSQLKHRLPPVDSAAVSASSFLMILGAAQPDVRRNIFESAVPLLMVGIGGFCYGITDICPYKIPLKISN